MTGAKSVKMADKEQLIIDVEGDEPTPKVTGAPPTPKVTDAPPRSNGETCCFFLSIFILFDVFVMGSSGILLRPSMVSRNVPATQVLDNLYQESQKASVTNQTRGFPFDNDYVIIKTDDGTIIGTFSGIEKIVEELKLNQTYNYVGTNFSTIIKSMNESMMTIYKRLYNEWRVDVNPLSYNNPERQIMIKMKAESKVWWADGLQLCSRQCVEYGTMKYYTTVVQCTRADSAFQDAMQNLTRIGGAGVDSFECNYTLQLAPNEVSAIWTNESCKTVLGNGLVYHEITQVTYKGEIRTLDNHNFGSIRKDMATWCECVKPIFIDNRDEEDFDDYDRESYEYCLDELGDSTASRAIIQGKGYQQACSKPGEVMLGGIPWKKYPESVT